MDKFQRKLRMLIATGSVVGFLGGWTLLAHAGKPVAVNTPSAPPAVVTPLTLPPLNFDSLDSSQSTNTLQPLPVQPAMPAFGFPRFRTGGS